MPHMPLFKPQSFDGTSGEISDKRFMLLVSSYHRPITEKLLVGALETLQHGGATQGNVNVIWVPGAWELAVTAKRVITDCDAVICLGAVVRGETTHDQHINAMLSQALGKLSMEYTKPVAFGVLTCNTIEQAIQRSGGRVGNKGEEATLAAIQLLRLFDKLSLG